MKIVLFSLLAATIALQGCSAPRKTSYQGSAISAAPRIPTDQIRRDRTLLMVNGDLPVGIKFKVLGEVRVRAGRPSTAVRMFNELELRGNYVGADAIVGINYHFSSTPFAVGASHVSGVAVKILNDHSPEDQLLIDDEVLKNARSWFLANLKDPSSAKFYDVYLAESPIPIVCGSVNAKNSHGGFTGNKKFFFSGAVSLNALDGPGDEELFAWWFDRVCKERRKDAKIESLVAEQYESVADEMQKLHSLYERGILNQSEYEKQKERLLK